MRRPFGHLKEMFGYENRTSGILSYLYVHPCFLYEDTLLHVMSKLLNVQFHIVTKDFSYTFSSSE